jgi:hypothetical protein
MTQLWRNGLITVVSLFLETCAFYLVFKVIGTLIQLPAAQVPFGLVFLTLLWSFILSMYLQTIRFSLNLRGALGLVLSLLSILVLANWSTGLGLNPIGKLLGADFSLAVGLALTLVFLVTLWWRGASIAHDEVTLDSIRGAFQWGLVVVICAAVLDTLTSADIVNGFLIVGFFAAGLAGLSLARFSSDSGGSPVMSKTWFVPIAASVGGVVILGLLISLIGIGGLDDVTRAILRLIGSVGLWVLKPVLLGLGFVAAALVALGNWLSSVFGGGDLSGLEAAQEQIRQFHESLGEVEQTGPPRLLVWTLKFIAFLAAASVAAWVLFRLFRFRRLLRHQEDVEETRESLFSWSRVNADLLGMLNNWRGANQGQPGGMGTLEPQNPREVYHRFLSLADHVGYPRMDWETPREHQRQLSSALPPAPVDRIVNDFQSEHYGHAPVERQEMEQLLRDWAALNQYVAERQQRESEGGQDADG